MKKPKKLKQMSKPELLALYDEFTLLPPETEKPTNDELRADLEDRYNITDEYLVSYREKKDTELTDAGQGDYSQFAEADDGQTVMCMDRKNASYSVGKYTFTQKRRYVVVDKATAEELLSRHSGFHKASREEIKRNLAI